MSADQAQRMCPSSSVHNGLQDVFIFDSIRTPRGKGRAARNGKPGGALSTIPPHKLVTGLIEAIGERHSPDVLGSVSSLTLGCVGQVGAQGGHIALISRLASPLANDVAVKSLNNYCVSGLTAAMDGAMRVQSEMDDLVLVGGVESLSHVPFLADKASYNSDPDMVRALKYAPPIMGAELVASLEGFGKADLDKITLISHQRAAKAWEQGFYDSHVITVKDESGAALLDRDELIRPNMTMEKLESMPPAFAEQGALGYDDMMLSEHPQLSEISHIHSIANCPGMADGASLILLGKTPKTNQGLKPLGKIIGFAETGADPVLQLTAGFAAMEKLLAQQNMTLANIDRIEFMEAFAAIPLKFLRSYDVDPAKVNVNGGHLAMGHPMGATGGILLTSLLHELIHSQGRYGLVVAQAGSGIGAAMLIERIE